MGTSQFRTYRERFTDSVTIRLPVGMKEVIEAHARKQPGPASFSDAVRALLEAGLAMDDARRSWRQQGSAAEYFNDVTSGAGPDDSRGNWEWFYSHEQGGLVPAVPVWHRLLEEPPLTKIRRRAKSAGGNESAGEPGGGDAD